MFRNALAVVVSSAIFSGCMDTEPTADQNNFIRCRSGSGADVVTVEIGAARFNQYSLNCISGEFVVDMSGCAPDGGYGLHISTGSASLERVVTRWQDYSDHFGGVVSHYITSTEIRFSGGFTFPSQGYSQDWEFLIDRIAGTGLLKKGRINKRYSCDIANSRF